MGLIEILFIFTGIYWISYLISLFVTASFDYKHLKLPLRITLGFIYFSFVNAIFFKIFSIQSSIILSIFLLLGISFVKNKNFITDSITLLKKSFRSSSFYFIFYLLLMNVFILPMHIRGHYTGFTEKGGDITIYSDISKYLVEHKEPAFGLQDGIDDLKAYFGPSSPGDNYTDYRDVKRLDPPYAEYAAYRTIATKWYTASHFAVTAEWFFLSNNHTLIFYAVLAFIYSSIICLFFVIVIDLGVSIAVLITFFLILSPSLISVFYNLYLLHVFSMLCIIFCFSIILNGKFRNINLHSDILVVFLFLSSSYFHVLPIVAIPYTVYIFSHAKDIKLSNLRLNHSFVVLQKFILSIILLIILVWFFIDVIGTSLWKFLSFFDVFFKGSGALDEAYMGKAVPIFSEKSFSFFSGLMTQDHYPPFFPNIDFLNIISKINFYSFSLLLLLSIVNFTRSIIKKMGLIKMMLFIFAIMFSIFFYAYSAKGYLYTQSKAAQYNLLSVYLILILLNRQLIKSSFRAYVDKVLVFFLSFLFLLQLVVFAIPRYFFLLSVSNSFNLSCVIEKSFYEKAKKIDKDSFVLIESEKPGCIYFITQPFFGGKMLPTKHLSLNARNIVLKNGVYDYSNNIMGLNASDFIDIDQSPEKIVYLYPETIMKKEVKYLGIKSEVIWGKKNMNEIKSPELVLTADLFEKDYGTTTIDGKTKRVHYSRSNGAGLLFFPNSKKDQVVTVEYKNAREETKIKIKPENLKFKAKSKFIESMKIEDKTNYIQVKILLKENKTPFLLHLPKLDQEYLINVETLDLSL